MISTKVIEEGEEIYWCYGAKYWRVWGPKATLKDQQAGVGAAVAAGGKRKHVGKTRRRERKGATGLGAGRRVTRVTRSAVERAARSEAGRERVGRVAERVRSIRTESKITRGN